VVAHLMRGSNGATRGRHLETLWKHHNAELRDPQQIVAQWQPASEIDRGLLRHSVRGGFWEAVARTGQTLFVTREYEHLVVALAVVDGRRRLSYLRLPHPNGLAVDGQRGLLYVASTRNPNMVYEFGRQSGTVPHAPRERFDESCLLPVRARYYPGRLYIHDLALVGGRLHASAVGLNAVVELPDAGGFHPVWWPRCIDAPTGPRFEKNFLQLNSIAAGLDLSSSFFSASAEAPSARRPGHLNFAVDHRGVVFSGRTREVCARGLTRPHSARLVGGRLWVANSGYGEIGWIEEGRFKPCLTLPGWTRGLAIHDDIAFVATSRVIPRFRHYAPGIDPARSMCGIHALDMRRGFVLGSLSWPAGNQVFAVELSGKMQTRGFPFEARAGATSRSRAVHFVGTADAQALKRH
jgi:uncharacterized protein (TIGR03032 family)